MHWLSLGIAESFAESARTDGTNDKAQDAPCMRHPRAARGAFVVQGMLHATAPRREAGTRTRRSGFPIDH